MIVSTKIAKMFKHPGFVNIDYLVKNKLERNPSKILNIINRDWRKWVKPLCMFDGGGLDPNFGYETIGVYSVTISSSGYEEIQGCKFTITEAGTADSITVALKRAAAGSDKVKCAIYKRSDLSLVGATGETSPSMTTSFAWYTFNFNAPKPSLTANTEYLLAVWADYTSRSIFLAQDTGALNQSCYQDKTYDSWPDPLVPSYSSYKNSIYCTYTTAAPPPPPVVEKPLISPPLISPVKVATPIIR
jgi:hypothetical protein